MHSSQIQQLPLQVKLDRTITWPVRLCPDHFQPAVQPARELGQPLRLAHYSRISPMRLIDQVIDAFALLHQQTPANLRIAGFIEDPEYHQQLLALIDQLGLIGRVTFVDPVPSPAEDPACSEVDLVWMISLSGHIGYAGIEAMAAGLPTLLLEVDSRADATPPDPELAPLICSNPQQLVARTLALQADPAAFCEQQAQLVRSHFMTTKEAIEELTNFYLGSR
jgi:glycosyltransferase involved in cell wall biosynthesis